MHKLITTIRGWATDTSGATAIEYGLIAAGISIAIVVIVFTLGGNVEGVFQQISDAISGGA